MRDFLINLGIWVVIIITGIINIIIILLVLLMYVSTAMHFHAGDIGYGILTMILAYWGTYMIYRDWKKFKKR